MLTKFKLTYETSWIKAEEFNRLNKEGVNEKDAKHNLNKDISSSSPSNFGQSSVHFQRLFLF